MPDRSHTRLLEPRSTDWQSFAWRGGCFDTGRRAATPVVEGRIRTPDHLLLVTLSGGAKMNEVRTDCGHRHKGPDFAGAVSFVPAHCERRLRLTEVSASWASIAIDPAALDRIGEEDGRPWDFAPFSNAEDAFIRGLVTEFARLHATYGGLEALYCESMAYALARYMTRRYGRPALARPDGPWKLPPWRLRRIADYVETHIEREILVEDLAALVGVSAGHLHRAFRATTGKTPLAFVNDRRIARARRILAAEPVAVTELALRVGFQSPSHFARLFRRTTGVNPSAYRATASR